MIDISKALALQARRYQRSSNDQELDITSLYQREYSWDKENDQLIEDICRGVDALHWRQNYSLSRTVILVTERNPAINIKRDNRALPPRIDNVIDANASRQSLYLLAYFTNDCINKEKVPNSSDYGGIEETVNSYLETL